MLALSKIRSGPDRDRLPRGGVDPSTTLRPPPRPRRSDGRIQKSYNGREVGAPNWDAAAFPWSRTIGRNAPGQFLASAGAVQPYGWHPTGSVGLQFGP